MTDAKPKIELIPADFEEIKKHVLRDAFTGKVIACPYCCNCRFIDEVRREAIKEVISYLRNRKTNAKNLYQMDNIEVTPKIALSIVSKMIDDCEKKLLGLNHD